MARDHFQTTRWSLVLAAGTRGKPEARRALEHLCEHYWQPLYAFVRHHGHPSEEACDLVQAFLLDVLERDALRVADPARGRFRSFLLGCLKHYLAHERERKRARKRGGGAVHFTFAVDEGEARYQPVSREPDPAVVFDRVWMATVLQQVLDRLQQSFQETDRAYYERLLPGLYDAKLVNYQEVAAAFEKSEESVRQAVSRLRKKYREYLLEEIGHTVSAPEDADDEIRELFQIASL